MKRNSFLLNGIRALSVLLVLALVGNLFFWKMEPAEAAWRENAPFGNIEVFNTAVLKAIVLGGDPYNGTDGTALNVTGTELNTLDLSAMGALVKMKTIAISSAPTGSEQDTLWDLPAKAFVIDVFIDVTTAEATGATKTIDIGTNGSGSNDPDGFADAIDVSSTGLKVARGTVTAGSSTKYFSANTRGELLSDYQAGTDADTDEGLYREKIDVTSGAESVTFTAGSADWVEFRGSIYILYIELSS